MNNQLTINQLVAESHDYATRKGFWPPRKRWWQFWIDENRRAEVLSTYKLCLTHSEVSEALEALRRGEPMDEELADIMIRVADLCGYLGIDLEHAIRDKMAFNEGRPPKHGLRF